MHSVECPLFVDVVYMEIAALKARSLCHEEYVIIFNTKEIRHFVVEVENILMFFVLISSLSSVSHLCLVLLVLLFTWV